MSPKKSKPLSLLVLLEWLKPLVVRSFVTVAILNQKSWVAPWLNLRGAGCDLLVNHALHH
jgi:hypothetical protein